MKKAVPVALVLIAGAAVVLWFGNRLNSWVVGGLIGGLASLLLSIPISLILFSYFARQHDEHGRYGQGAHKRLRSGRAVSRYDYLPRERDADYYEDDEYGVVDGYASSEVDDGYTVAEEYSQRPPARRKSGWLDEEFGSPAPPSRQLPPAASSRRTGHISSRHQPAAYGSQQQRTAPTSHDASDHEKRQRTTGRRTAYPGLPGSQQSATRTRLLTQALRTARLEAAQQSIEEDDVYIEDDDMPTFDPSTRSREDRQRRTGQLPPDPFSEDVHKPLQRRAPYMYDDDEIRQEMARYEESPSVRRSSRYTRGQKNED